MTDMVIWPLLLLVPCRNPWRSIYTTVRWSSKMNNNCNTCSSAANSGGVIHLLTAITSTQSRSGCLWSVQCSPWLSHTLQPTHINWNWICLMVWNTPVWANHHANFLCKCVFLTKPQAGVMWWETWRRRSAGVNTGVAMEGSSVDILSRMMAK